MTNSGEKFKNWQDTKVKFMKNFAIQPTIGLMERLAAAAESVGTHQNMVSDKFALTAGKLPHGGKQ